MAESIAPESACTSVQLHLQVAPESFADYWNAAQVIAGAQLAVGANSPYLFGKELWRETRIALFDQATDTRSDELKEQGVRPRVWFGERWITSIFDLFEENVRYFPALLPICDDEDPAVVLDRGDPPKLSELRLHNGTVYRWNRPVYDVVARRAAPAGGEPGAARRADGRRHGRQRRVLLRPGARARRRRAAAVVADVVRRGRRELPRRAPSAASTRCCSGRARARCPRRSWCCGGCCRWPTRACSAGTSTRRCATGCSASSSSGACTGQNGASWQVGDRAPAPGAAPPGPARRAAGDGAALRRAHAHQRAGAHLAGRGLPRVRPPRPPTVGGDLRERAPHLVQHVGDEHQHDVRLRGHELLRRDHRHVGARHAPAELGRGGVGDPGEQRAVRPDQAEQTTPPATPPRSRTPAVRRPGAPPAARAGR